ncbi:hypothetical protein HUJ05_008695 [Dendroctonus ponderosae]|nr:hypothetical protein HUJ05_006787 [Dendroctonus ponderosae]KAH1002121.1 hypothetical protein HUJ05_008695 [Dendroctonus ponderosae]
MGDIIGEEQLNSNKLDLLQEVKKYSELIRIYRKKSNKYKIRLECILDCLENKDMEPQLKNKVKKIILSARVSQIQLCSDPNSVKCETQNLLGVPVNNIKLTYSERETLAFFLKYPIDTSADNSKQEFFLELPYNDKVLLEYRSKLALNQQEFINNQTQMFAVLEEMMKFRLKTVPELSKIKCKEYENILMQEKNSLPALTELIKDMKEQKIEFLRKIDELKDLKKTYEDASCKEYDAILQSYLQYKAVLNRKKQMEALPI